MHRATWAVKRAHYKSWAFERKVLKKHKVAITPARFDALYVLLERGRMMQATLQRVLGVVKSTVSELLKDLEKRGLVHRGARTRSGRVVQISDAGKSTIGTANAYWAQFDIQADLIDAFQDSGFGICVLERACRRVRKAAGHISFERIYKWVPYYE